MAGAGELRPLPRRAWNFGLSGGYAGSRTKPDRVMPGGHWLGGTALPAEGGWRAWKCGVLEQLRC